MDSETKEIQLKTGSQYNLKESKASKKSESKTDKGSLDNEIKINAKELKTLVHMSYIQMFVMLYIEKI